MKLNHLFRLRNPCRGFCATPSAKTHVLVSRFHDLQPHFVVTKVNVADSLDSLFFLVSFMRFVSPRDSRDVLLLLSRGTSLRDVHTFAQKKNEEAKRD